jgi:HTH-type transcriptional regulator/antitoxin HigA
VLIREIRVKHLEASERLDTNFTDLHELINEEAAVMRPKVIKTESEYAAALARIDKLMDARRNTPQGEELELLSLLVHDYEEKAFPIDKPDPVAAIRFRMQQQGLRPRDLVPFLGSRSRVSEVLSGRRNLSLKMIRALVSGLGIPAEVLLGGS